MCYPIDNINGLVCSDSSSIFHCNQEELARFFFFLTILKKKFWPQFLYYNPQKPM